jgi:hypothetical protein
LHFSVLERTESDLSKINWLRAVILLNPIVSMPRGRFSLCHTLIRPISAFRDQISILIVGCVTTSYPSVIFVFFCSFKFFNVCVHLLVLRVCVIEAKKKVIFHLVTVSNHISILKRKKERDRERD